MLLPGKWLLGLGRRRATVNVHSPLNGTALSSSFLGQAGKVLGKLTGKKKMIDAKGGHITHYMLAGPHMGSRIPSPFRLKITG